MTLSNPGNSNAESKLRTMPELLAMILPKPQHIFEHSGTFVNSMSNYPLFKNESTIVLFIHTSWCHF